MFQLEIGKTNTFFRYYTYFKRTYKFLLRVLLNVVDIDVIPFTEYIWEYCAAFELKF